MNNAADIAADLITVNNFFILGKRNKHNKIQQQ